MAKTMAVTVLQAVEISPTTQLCRLDNSEHCSQVEQKYVSGSSFESKRAAMPLFKSKEEKARIKEEKRLAKEEKRRQKQMLKLEKAREKERAKLTKRGLLPPQQTPQAAPPATAGAPGSVPTTPMGAISTTPGAMPAPPATTTTAPVPPPPPPVPTTTGELQKQLGERAASPEEVEREEPEMRKSSRGTTLPVNPPPGWTPEKWSTVREQFEIERRQLIDMQRLERDRLQRLHELELDELRKREQELQARYKTLSTIGTTIPSTTPTTTAMGTSEGQKRTRLSIRDQLRTWRQELTTGQTLVDDEGNEYVVMEERPRDWDSSLYAKSYSQPRPLGNLAMSGSSSEPSNLRSPVSSSTIPISGYRS